MRRGWRSVAGAHTRKNGRFVFHHVDRGGRDERVRLSFAGDASNAGAATRARRVIALRPEVASWYEDAGNTACGFHATDGVANKELPCGTKVTFDYHGRTVTAVVDDRGPFVPGREFDLNQNTAAALGFAGVDTVWSSI
jgi:rare lipoprotein A (peptidoglycan hydrolase)